LKKVPRLFGTNGIRGVVGKDIDVDFAFRLGCSASALFRTGGILVGRDGRDSSRMLEEGLAAGILSQGRNVVSAGLIPTPALQFLVKDTAAEGGIVITASHNPPEYNGFKVVDSDGVEVPRAKEERIERMMDARQWRFSKKTGKRFSPEGLLETYLRSLKHHSGATGRPFRGLKVVVDCGNGVAGLTTPRVLAELGCEVVTMNDNIDGSFAGRPSEPRPENLGGLSRTVLEEGADLGVAHDGDGDRALFVDETGTVHWGDRTFALVEDEVLRENRGGRVVTPVNSSMAVREIAAKRGGKLVLTKVGSIFVSRTMLATGAVLGGEENGGIFYAPHHPVRDGTMAALLVLKAMARNRIKLSRLLGRLPRFFMAKEKFECREDARKKRAIALLRAKLGRRVTSTLDGVRVDVKGRGWVLVRASGTEPLVRLYAEGRTEKELSGILKEFRPMVREAVGG
jgi:phosphomannomutase/phosphoglucomutase